MDLRLDANEGPGLEAPWLSVVLDEITPEDIRRYPSARPLEHQIGCLHGIEGSRVLVTAGADESIERVIRATADRARGVICTTPTFEMIPRAARSCQASVREVSWLDGQAPVDEIIDRLDETVGVVALVTPNNPTGLAATSQELLRLSGACQRTGAALLVDLAYVEYADEDPSAALLDQPNTVILRTLSKAWGLAGLRVGYAAGDEGLIGWARAIGGPYPVSAISLAIAEARLRSGYESVGCAASRNRVERRALTALLESRGVSASDSQANFVLARFGSSEDCHRVWAGLAKRGIGVRRFKSRAGLEDALRVTCPGHDEEFERLMRALGECLDFAGDR